KVCKTCSDPSTLQNEKELNCTSCMHKAEPKLKKTMTICSSLPFPIATLCYMYHNVDVFSILRQTCAEQCRVKNEDFDKQTGVEYNFTKADFEL
ncbi:Uncharacterised protein at_DN0682, partial [Pycnogonum litorale]